MNCSELNRLLDDDPQILEDGSIEMRAIERHALTCSDCRESIAAARLAHALIGAREQEHVVPSIYFASRVAALARDSAQVRGASFESLWRSARVVVSSLVLLILALLTLNYAQRTNSGVLEEPVQADTQYSLEKVIVDDGGQQPLTNAQVLDSIFDSGDSYGANR